MRRRNRRLPSTSHKLVLLGSDSRGHRTLHKNAQALSAHTVDVITKLVGSDRRDWAIARLLELPEVVRPGWKAKRRRAVR
jgi:hypothetical protein